MGVKGAALGERVWGASTNGLFNKGSKWTAESVGLKRFYLLGHIRAVQRGRFKHVRLNCIVTVSLQNEKHFQVIRYTEFPRVWTRDVPSRLALPAERAQQRGFGTTTKKRATTPVAAPRACAAAAGMMLALTFTCRLLLLLLLSEPVHSNRSAV